MTFFPIIEYLFFFLAFSISVYIAFREGFKNENIVLVFITLVVLCFHSRYYIPASQSGWLYANDHLLVKAEMLIEVGLYLLLYIALLRNRARRFFLAFYLILYLIFSFIVLTLLQPIYELKYPIYSFVFGSFGALVGILLFFYEKLKSDDAENIFTNFWFWISTGLFIFLATEIPILSITNYLFGKEDAIIYRAQVALDIKQIISLFYYFTFIIGVLCSRTTT